MVRICSILWRNSIWQLAALLPTEENFDALFRINTKGRYSVMQAAARHVSDGGRIINIASSSTSRPQPGLLYGTSKTAPKYVVRVLALELGPAESR